MDICYSFAKVALYHFGILYLLSFRSCSTYFLHIEQWWHLSGLIAWHISQYLAAGKKKRLNNNLKNITQSNKAHLADALVIYFGTIEV